jgi:hypothetical protein
VAAGNVESEITLPAETMYFQNLAATGLAIIFKRASMVSSCAVVGGYTSLTPQLGKM